jgi:hypothetical protein
MDFNLWNVVFSLPILLILTAIFWQRDGRAMAAKLNALILPNPPPSAFSGHQPYRFSIKAADKKLLRAALEETMNLHLRCLPSDLEAIAGMTTYTIHEKKFQGQYTGEASARLRPRR